MSNRRWPSAAASRSPAFRSTPILCLAARPETLDLALELCDAGQHGRARRLDIGEAEELRDVLRAVHVPRRDVEEDGAGRRSVELRGPEAFDQRLVLRIIRFDKARLAPDLDPAAIAPVHEE